jgi:putative transposase
MDDYESLSHSKWECKYHVVFCHVVFIPKYRRKMLYGELRQHLGEVFSQTGDAKGKQSRGRPSDAGSCSHDDLDPAEIRGLASDRLYQEQERDPFGPCLRGGEAQFHRPALWASGYFVSTVGRDEAVIREYIRKQEAEDSRLDQLNVWR